MQRCQFVLAALITTCTFCCVAARAQDGSAAGVRKPRVEAVCDNPGDTRSINFTLPFEKAMEKAKREQRLVFLKPIYGGMDTAGAKDYRTGSW